MDSECDEWSEAAEGAGGGAWAARALAPGWVSRAFSTADLLRHCCASEPMHMLVDSESGAALAAARLARDVQEAHLRLEAAETAGVGVARVTGVTGGSWRVRCERAAAPGTELRLWPADSACLPFLTPDHIRGKKEYVCLKCGARFERPNPLKVHIFLNCKPFSRRRFWSQFLSGPPPPPPALTPPAPVIAAEALRRLHPAAAEALAAAWGGAGRGGHACLYCGRVYSRRYGLKIHVRTHTGYKPLRCSHCRRAFADPSNLNKHLRLHRAAPPSPSPALPHPASPSHVCALCGAVVARRRDLQRHMRTRHGQTDIEMKCEP